MKIGPWVIAALAAASVAAIAVTGCGDDEEASQQRGSAQPAAQDKGGSAAATGDEGETETPTTADEEAESSTKTAAPEAATGCPATDVEAQLERPGTVHHRDVKGEETWKMEGSPHRFPKGIKIVENAKVTIGPCALVIIGDGRWLEVNGGGTLVSAGEEGKPVRITSAAAEPAPGAWAQVIFRAKARPQSKLSHTIIEDAGGANPHAAVVLDDGFALSVNEVTIRGSKQHGVYLRGEARFAEGSKGLTVTESGRKDPYSAPVWFRSASQVRTLPEGKYSGNEYDEIYVHKPEVRTTATWRNPGVPYRLNEGLRVGSANGAVLTIEAGSTLAFNQDQAFVVGWHEDGSAVLAGTEEEPITLTSARPHPDAGDWAGLRLGKKRSNSALDIDWVVMEHAGGEPPGWTGLRKKHTCREDSKAGIAIAEEDAGEDKITNVTFKNLDDDCAAILVAVRADDTTDYTAKALGNDFSEAGTECRQNLAPAEGDCPDPACR